MEIEVFNSVYNIIKDNTHLISFASSLLIANQVLYQMCLLFLPAHVIVGVGRFWWVGMWC
ncbi:MAG: hypothetical protein KA275_08510 [Chitinophagaceae bacterium]|nr:hypothetical protein [Chitinophagaceae bacterium]